jgi:integrase
VTFDLQRPNVKLALRAATGEGHEWVFHSRKGTPLNPGNARRRHLHPAAKALGIRVGGWHDFRHTLIRKMRRGGVHPVVVSAVVGHKRVELAPKVYDRATLDEKRKALGVGGRELRCSGDAVGTDGGLQSITRCGSASSALVANDR